MCECLSGTILNFRCVLPESLFPPKRFPGQSKGDFLVQEAEAKTFAAGDEKHQGPTKNGKTQVEIAMLFPLRIPVAP